jgi:hypothetical protein
VDVSVLAGSESFFPVFLVSILFYLPTFLMSKIASFLNPFLRSLSGTLLARVSCPVNPPVPFLGDLEQTLFLHNISELASSCLIRGGFLAL